MPTYSPQEMVTQPYPGKAYPSPGNVSSSTPSNMLTHPPQVKFVYPSPGNAYPSNQSYIFLSTQVTCLLIHSS